MKTPKNICTADLETLTGLSGRHMRDIAKAGYFPPPRNGQYEFEATIKGMFRYRADEAAKKQGELARVKLEREQNKNRKEKVEADRAESSVVPKFEAGRAVTRFVAGLVHRLLPIPIRVSQRFALETDPQAIESFLTEEIRAAIKGADQFKYGLLPCPKCKQQIDL